MTGPAPRRVRITAPPGPVRLPASRPGPDPLADVYLRSLVRAQLRLALAVALGFLLLLVGLAVLVVAWPQIHEVRLWTVPLPWLVLGAGVYPIALLGAVAYTRVATRNEARYREFAQR